MSLEETIKYAIVKINTYEYEPPETMVYYGFDSIKYKGNKIMGCFNNSIISPIVLLSERCQAVQYKIKKVKK